MRMNIHITNGPSKEELFDGLRLTSEKRLILFSIENNGKEMFTAAYINSIEAEDGSGESWNIRISIDKKFISPFPKTIKLEKRENGTFSAHITFSTIKESIKRQRLGQDDCIINAIYPKESVVVKAYYSTKIRQGFIIG